MNPKSKVESLFANVKSIRLGFDELTKMFPEGFYMENPAGGPPINIVDEECREMIEGLEEIVKEIN